MIREFLVNEQGQDLTEYSLLIAFISLITLSFLFNLDSAAKIWNVMDGRIGMAREAAYGNVH
jgi:Flp pilus assembly pilin Flp